MTDFHSLAARKRAAADQIVVENDRAELVRERVRYLVEHARHNNGGCALGTLIVGPRQTGKSTILRTISSELNRPEAIDAGELPALFVTLDEQVTRKQLAQNIASALEDHGFNAGPFDRKREGRTEAEVFRRLRIQLSALKCKLLILDEFHQIKNVDSQKVAFSVGEAIKRFLIAGVCPVVMSGLEDAREPFTTNEQLAKRCLDEIYFKPLQVQEAADAELFIAFLKSYLAELQARGILNNTRDLLAGSVSGGIFLVTEGVLGDACNLIKYAMDECTLSGRDRVSLADLSLATKKYFGKGPNPFENMNVGVRERRAA
jgi:hypothetical protein